MATVEVTQTTPRQRVRRARAGAARRRAVSRTVRSRAAARRQRRQGIARRVWSSIRGHPWVTASVAMGAGAAAGFLARHALEDRLHHEARFLGMTSGLGRGIGTLGAAALLGGVAPAVVRRVRKMMPGRSR